jgi:hypothetical protein
MKVGTITVDGRQVGVVNFTEGSPDTFAPDLSEGLSGHPIGYEPTAHNHHHVGHIHGDQHHESDRPVHRHGHGHYARGEQREKEQDQKSSEIGNITYSSSGNPFDRSRFAKELQDKPWLRDKMAHISLGENQDPRANTAVLETMMNRAIVRGTSLEAQAKRHRSSGVDEGGYYAGWAPHYSSEKSQMFERNLGNVLAGSNVSNYATDNSSGDLAARERSSGAFVHHMTINGENFFSPGTAEPAQRNRWQELNRRAGEFERGKTAEAAAKPFDPETQVP